MIAKVHYSWLGTDRKKTYLLLSIQNADTPENNSNKNHIFYARLLGVVVALWLSDADKINVWIKIITQLLIP